MTDVSRCRSCSAEIIWARTVNGRAMPLDRWPIDGGNVTVDEHNLATVHGKPIDGVAYVSHFATCPGARNHRRKS